MTIQSHIRFAKPEDINQIIELCQAHAIYEKCDYSKENKVEQLTKDLFSEKPKLYCLVVESNNELIAYATYMIQYATWDAYEYIYMDCLFIKELARGLRIGERLVKRIQLEGKLLRCNLVQWQTPDFNKRAITFYKRIGATSKPKERFFLEIN
jgi:L-amino acid N-acyltransferase YncA